MTRLRKRIVIASLALLGLLVAGALALLVVVRSNWFFHQVRTRLVATVEQATGGRVEIGAFSFDWTHLRAEMRNFVIHGTEPAGKPPLLRAERVTVGLKVISLLRRDVDIESLDVTRPQVYLIVAEGGRTNVPEPKVRSTSSRGAMETILELAVGRVALEDGAIEVEARGRTPFDVRGEKLRAKFGYQALGSRYEGDLSISPLHLAWPDLAPLAIEVAVHAVAERNRVTLSDARFSTGGTQLTVSGALDELARPHGSFTYRLRAELSDVVRALKERTRLEGTVLVSGRGVYNGGSDFTATGALHGDRISYRDASMYISRGRADGAVDITLERVRATSVRITALYVDSTATAPASAQIRTLELKGKDLTARGLTVATLGGTFQGDGELRGFARYLARGELAGFEIRKLVALYSPEPLPWDGRLSGTTRAEGSLKNRKSVAVEARVNIAPAAQGPPVHGEVALQYDAASGVLDLGQSHVELPHSRLDFSGAVGKRMRVFVETRDLNDILPAVGAASVPLRVDSGAVKFEGSVTGTLDRPQIDGRLTTARVSYRGTAVDSLEGDITASPDRVQVRNVRATRGPMRAQGEGGLALENWKSGEASAVLATLAIRTAPLEDLLIIANGPEIEAMGTVEANADLTGTVSRPAIKGSFTVLKGSIEDEAFDKLTAQLSYGNRVLQVAQAQIVAGPRQVDLSGSYEHEVSGFDSGRLRFKVASNTMPLDQFRSLEKWRPGLRGTVTLSTSGVVEVEPPRPGRDRLRVTELAADIRGRDLQLTGQPLGDVRLTATSEGKVLRARLASDFANSRIRGDGQWRLEGDYPGSATVTFTQLDFQQLRAWVSPKRQAGQFDIAGSAEGELKVEGPAATPSLWKATLRIPKLEAGPPAAGPLAAGRAALTLRNEGPIVANMVNQVVTVESARLVGRSSDITLTGRVAVQQRSPLDLRVNGRVDLAIVQDFSRDILSSGSIQLDGGIRGSLAAPQVNGRMELKDAAMSLADFPNGLSKANGVIVFTGDRATIQSLSGQTGGGKVTLSGFAGFGGDEPVFRINASAEEVRVRYPEGVSTVADAELNLTGTPSRSMLAGTITIVRTGFNPQSDFSSILAKSAEPVRTASTRTGFLGGLNFDVQIETSPDITFQSSLAEGLQVEANMRLRGTASNPAVLGRINVTQGQIAFFGTKYTINQGSIAFYNPVKVEPVLNIDLETKARGIDVTLTVSGPLNKLQLTPRSDPPLQFNEIVALLATGRTPTSGVSSNTATSNSPQNWQQAGASALLGQAIANPVAGRLQRFFGVSKLKIDPSLTGLENNPQARLTLEQQVSQNVTFTYITNVTSSNPQVVRVEWAFARQWSVVAVREENGLFGLDFFYKKRFK